MLGIPNYQAHFYEDPTALLQAHGATLRQLIGKTLHRFWVMWDPTEDEWWPDGPVILEIGEDRLELCAWQLSAFSLTLNEIDLKQPLEWYGAQDDIPLQWKENGVAAMQDALGLPILGIDLLTFSFKGEFVESGEAFATDQLLHGFEFRLEAEEGPAYFSIFNALDQNGLMASRVEQGDQIGRIKIA